MFEINDAFSILGIIPCSKAKIWDELPAIGRVYAENAYINPFHALARTYISLFTNNWIILSAKFGFLNPDEILEETYDVTFDRLNDSYIKVSTLQKQVIDKNLHKYNNIIIVCNNRYVDFVKKAFENYNCRIYVPFKDIEDDEQGSNFLNQQIFKIRENNKC